MTAKKYAAEANSIAKRTFDTFGALLFLARQPFVDPHRVAVVGASQGGSVTLSVAETRSFELFVNPSGLAFQAAVALYPLCFGAGARPAIPTLILVGALDDWTPAEDCTRLVARWGSGPSVELVVYPGAYHAFDVLSLQPGRTIFGHWLEYNADASNDANRRIRKFLAQHLDK